MQSVEIPAVTNARASGDYHAGQDQWKQLGTTGIFAWAVAIAPTKDNYWSTDVQTGSGYSDHDTIKEPANRLQAVVSTLSKGPVAPSDKIGRSDSRLIMKSCAKDGRLLQGDHPAMTVDKVHAAKAFGSLSGQNEVWQTTTTLDGAVFSVVMGATLDTEIRLDIAQDLGLAGSYVAYEANATSKVPTAKSVTLQPCGKWDFQLYALAPVLGNGWTFLGEQDKWVPVSAARFSDLMFASSKSGADSSASVIATGSEGEVINVSWLAPGLSTPTVVSCTIAGGSKVYVEVSTAHPTGVCQQV